MAMSDKKYYSMQITRRFLKAMDNIIANREHGKVTAQSFGEVVGISGSNLIRLRSSKGENVITVEALGRICDKYNVSADWLVTGAGKIFVGDKEDPVEKRLNRLESEIKYLKQKMPK
jgi:transcriptional regulator with XRE-family HTH domain